MDATHGLLAGLAAGLAVAVPLGAIGALVVDLGLREGARSALAAGLGVATVDAAYALLAFTAGASLAAGLTGARQPLRAVAAAVLAALALVLLRRALAEHARGAAPRTADQRSGPGRPRRRGLYARFVALTAVNPLTLATFSAVATGLPGNRTAPGPATAVTFVAGVALASASWHAILAGASGLAGRRLPPAARTWTSISGAALTLLLALRLVA